MGSEVGRAGLEPATNGLSYPQLREHDQRLRLLVRVGDGASQVLGGGV
jgi:hypothetical protein